MEFWKTTPLGEMTKAQWESLCDGCGRCCLVKLEEEDTGRIYFTDVPCRLFDGESCRCRDYANRSREVADCVSLNAGVVGAIGWLPSTCAYRLVAEGRDLYWWHPLVSGDPETVHAAGVSVRGRLGPPEGTIPPENYSDRLVDWPLRWPKGARRKTPPPAQS